MMLAEARANKDIRSKTSSGDFCALGWPYFLTLALLACQASATEPPLYPASMRVDAELTAVTFVDADHGWVVGDRGVIRHTQDGGRTWSEQRAPTAARLEAISFLDPLNGYIVGGWTQPYSHHTSGLLLRTRDGGRSWQLIPNSSLPGLRYVKFFNAKQGWVLGDASSLYPSGAFSTEDGGKTWTPVAKGETTGWVAGDVPNFSVGAFASRTGQLVFGTAAQLTPSRIAPLGRRVPRRITVGADAKGWLVGDGGLVLTTADNGHSWTGIPGELPAAARTDFDFRAVATFYQHCWIAGNPGTCVFHSADGGKTWETLLTDQALPLRAITFLNAERGWAVGSLGTILGTHNGGKTWHVQHSGGKRVALLGIFSQPENIAWEVLAQQSGNEGYLSAIELLGRQDIDTLSSESLTVRERAHEGIVTSGACQAETAWQFPLKEAGLAQSAAAILAHWNQANDGQATKLIEEHLVRRIRTWRPDVIVTEDVSLRGEFPLAHLTNQMALSAVQKAADPTCFSDQITLSGLTEWKVKKVFAMQSDGRQGAVNVTPSQWASRLGRSVADQVELGRSLVATELQERPTHVGLSLLVDHLPQNTGRRDIFSGLVLLPGGDARRELGEPLAGDLETLAKAAQKRHNIEQLLKRMERNEFQGAAWIGQVSKMTDGLSERSAGEIVFQMAQRFQQLGRGDVAAETMNLLVQRYPNHPLADSATLWLVQYYASGEVAWRERKSTRFTTTLATVEHNAEQTADEQAAGNADDKSRVVPASAIQGQGSQTLASGGLTTEERAAKAIAAAEQIERARPMQYSSPALRFSLANAQKIQGQSSKAEKFFQNLSTLKADDPWSRCALAELWVGHGTSTAPTKLVTCRTAVVRPRLDGRLDDEIWRASKPVSLTSSRPAAGETPATVVVAYDDAYLYFAISAKKIPGGDYAADDKPRTPDAKLAKFDHVQLILDIDRDYGSYYVLGVDCRGKTADSCFGDESWNPSWYVATGSDAEYWTVEAAIPLAELVPRPPQAKQAWGIGLQRVIPNQGVQSFSHPAGIKIRPEGFGLLMFE